MSKKERIYAMKKLMMLLAVLALAILLPTVVYAAGGGLIAKYTDAQGPHNENGNSTLDVFVEDDFQGGVDKAIDDINNTTNRNKMPLVRKVDTREEADLVVFYDETIQAQTSSYFQHNPNMPDYIRINTWEQTQPRRLGTGKPFFHEFGHDYSRTHQYHDGVNDPECATIEGGSVMCKDPYNSADSGGLSPHDDEVSRRLSNKREGYTNVIGRMAAPVLDPKFTVR
jgi:hypothetical protein